MARLGRSQPFPPIIRRALSAAGGNQTVGAGSAIAAWTLGAAVVLASVTVAAPTAVATWAVPAPTVVAPSTIAASSASAAWTVPAVTVLQPGIVTAPTATAAWTVPAATVVAGAITVSAPTAIATWVATAPSVNGGAGLTADACNTFTIIGETSLTVASDITTLSVVAETDTFDVPGCST